MTGVAKNGAGDDASLIWIASDGGSSLDLAEAGKNNWRAEAEAVLF